MSAINFFLERGHTPVVKNTSIYGADTIAVWTPLSDKRVMITNVNLAAGALDSTISFFFADRQNPVAKIGTFGVPASLTINLDIGCWESTAVGGVIYARKNTTLNEMTVNLTGFEV